MEKPRDETAPEERLVWGTAPHRPLPASARRWLRTRIGWTGPDGHRPSSPDGAFVPAGADLLDRWYARHVGTADAEPLAGPVRAALAGAAGEAHVRTDLSARLAHAGGMSYVDLVRRRDGVPAPLPDAVVLPADHGEVEAVLRACSEHDVALVPFGGGTSVVGGVEAVRGRHAAVVALDLARLDQLVAVDRESRTATLQAGLRGPQAERLLAAVGLTLGHVPQSFERATIGGFAATRSAGQASSGYGRFDEMVVALRVATPAGTLDLGRAPMSAAGPDLRHLVLGSEGAFGVITEVTVRVHPLPRRRRYEVWSFPSFEKGTGAVRHLAQHGILPDVTRLSDDVETETTFALAGTDPAVLAGRLYLRSRRQARPCLLVLGWEGSPREVRHRRAAALPALRGRGGVALGQRPGRAWQRDRFAGPYLRDTLLDAGLLVETLETAASWSRLTTLHAAVTAALRDALGGTGTPLVTCHLSHAYPTGASLYFTVVATRDADDPAGQWRRAKRAATDAIADAGATITHHHAVGLDHRPWMEREVGELGVEVLRAVKDRLDPKGLLNPGKLVPPREPSGG